MASFNCPMCGDSEQLKGRREDNVIHVSCGACGHDWIRDPNRCPKCGELLDSFRIPLLHKARGTQQSILGYRVQKRCMDCEGPPPPPETSATLDTS